MKILAIDPSVNEVGWAYVEGLVHDDDGWHDENANWKWGHWKIESNSLTFKLKEITEWIILEAGGLDHCSDWLVAEWPAYFDGMKGHVSAKMGHTINLAAVDAYIAGYFRLPWQNIHLITATEWKGNVSKEITRMRFFRHMGIKQIYKVNHNAVDAVMMLLTFCKRKNITGQIVSKIMEPIPHLEEPETQDERIIRVASEIGTMRPYAKRRVKFKDR